MDLSYKYGNHQHTDKGKAMNWMRMWVGKTEKDPRTEARDHPNIKKFEDMRLGGNSQRQEEIERVQYPRNPIKKLLRKK